MFPKMNRVGDAFRLSLRRMARAPLAALPPIIVVALTVLAVTLAISLIQGVLLKSLPYPDSDELVHVGWQTGPSTAAAMDLPGSAAEFVIQQSDLFADVTRISDAGSPVVIGLGDEAHAASSIRADARFLSTLGLRPSRGRTPNEEEAKSRIPQALVSTKLWERHFGAEPFSAKTLTIDGVEHEILGVLPEDFQYTPVVEALLPWVPGGAGAGGHNTRVLARLKPQVQHESTQTQLDGRTRPVMASFGGSVEKGATPSIVIKPLKSVVVGDAGDLLFPIVGVVGLLVVLAALNLANLQLATLMARRAETTVRSVLGADAWTLRLPGISEATIRVAFGTVTGFALAAIAMPVVIAVLPASLPRLDDVSLDPSTLAYVALVSLLLLAMSLLVTLFGERSQADSLRGQGKGSRALGLQPMLVAGQVTLSVTLLAGALMSVGSLERLLGQDPGYKVSGIDVATLLLPAGRYGDPATAGVNTTQDSTRLLDAIIDVPGVVAVATSSSPPLAAGLNNFVTAQDTPAGQAGASVEMRIVSPGYLDVLGIRLLTGRDFTRNDALGTPPVAIVNDRFAKLYLLKGGEIGARINVGGVDHEVIGISADIRELSLRSEPIATVLVAQAQVDPALQAAVNRWFGINLLIRSAPGTPVESALREGLGAVGYAPVLRQLRPLTDFESESISRERLLSTMLTGFTSLAILLAAVGLYALLEHLRNERVREFAVRLALGSVGSKNALLLLKGQAWLTAVGLLSGAVGAFLLSRGISHLLYGSEALIPGSIAAAVTIVFTLSLVAGAKPLLSVARLSPATALRSA